MSTRKLAWNWCDNFDKDQIGQLWQEYQYRHAHVWKTVFQATLAIIALSVVPYLDAANAIGEMAFAGPFLGGVLGASSIVRIVREFRLLDPVKNEYLDRTRKPANTQNSDETQESDETPESDKMQTRAKPKRISWFKWESIAYLSVLTFGAFSHFCLLISGRIPLISGTIPL